METWFTSDWHLGHKNIIKYCNRPFKTVEEMNKTIIDNFNNKVNPGDIIFFLGDFSFDDSFYRKYQDLLNGNWIFIRGNHDHHKLPYHIEELILELGKQETLLIHDPSSYEETIKRHIVGHVHEKWKIKKTDEGNILINVGVDVWDFKPVSMEEILQLFDKEERQ